MGSIALLTNHPNILYELGKNPTAAWAALLQQQIV
jgi:hypothetical protein